MRYNKVMPFKSHTLAFIFLVILCLPAAAKPRLKKENLAYFQDQEATLKVMARDILYGYSDNDKLETSEKFSKLLRTVLNHEQSFLYPFDSLVTIARVVPSDKAFRILNWNLPMKDGTFRYFGYIQKPDKKNNTSILFELNDVSDEITEPERQLLSNKKWLGAHYYTAIPEKKKRSKYYTLIGWDGNTTETTKKVIDVMYFEGNTVRFGAPLFNYPKHERANRLVFEYSSQAVMSIRYYADTKRIVMDHLAPSKPQFEGQLRYYGPDMTYDALVLEDGKWTYVPNIDMKNSSNGTLSEVAPTLEDRSKLEQGTKKGLFPKKP